MKYCLLLICFFQILTCNLNAQSFGQSVAFKAASAPISNSIPSTAVDYTNGLQAWLKMNDAPGTTSPVESVNNLNTYMYGGPAPAGYGFLGSDVFLNSSAYPYDFYYLISDNAVLDPVTSISIQFMWKSDNDSDGSGSWGGIFCKRILYSI